MVDDPQASDLWRLIDRHFDSLQQVYDDRYQAKYGYWRPIIEQSVTAYLKCGDLHEGFARVRCPDCKHEMFVAFSCKQRCTCPSCHQKRTLLTAMQVAEDVCFLVAHRQVENMRGWEHSDLLTYVDIDTFLENF